MYSARHLVPYRYRLSALVHIVVFFILARTTPWRGPLKNVTRVDEFGVVTLHHWSMAKSRREMYRETTQTLEGNHSGASRLAVGFSFISSVPDGGLHVAGTSGTRYRYNLQST